MTNATIRVVKRDTPKAQKAICTCELSDLPCPKHPPRRMALPTATFQRVVTCKADALRILGGVK